MLLLVFPLIFVSLNVTLFRYFRKSVLLYSLLFDTWSFPKENINKMLKPRQHNIGHYSFTKKSVTKKIAHRNPLNRDFLWFIKSVSQLNNIHLHLNFPKSYQFCKVGCNLFSSWFCTPCNMELKMSHGRTKEHDFLTPAKAFTLLQEWISNFFLSCWNTSSIEILQGYDLEKG